MPYPLLFGWDLLMAVVDREGVATSQDLPEDHIKAQDLKVIPKTQRVTVRFHFCSICCCNFPSQNQQRGKCFSRFLHPTLLCWRFGSFGYDYWRALICSSYIFLSVPSVHRVDYSSCQLKRRLPWPKIGMAAPMPYLLSVDLWSMIRTNSIVAACPSWTFGHCPA